MGPFQVSRHSRQISVMRSMSACAADQTAMRRPSVRRFIGSDDRRAEKPECISPAIERQRARAIRSPGYMPACGKTSCRYSAIASVSHTVTPSCTRQGTRIDEARSSSSARVSGSSDATTFSSNSRRASRASRKPRSDQEE